MDRAQCSTLLVDVVVDVMSLSMSYSVRRRIENREARENVSLSRVKLRLLRSISQRRFTPNFDGNSEKIIDISSKKPLFFGK